MQTKAQWERTYRRCVAIVPAPTSILLIIVMVIVILSMLALMTTIVVVGHLTIQIGEGDDE